MVLYWVIERGYYNYPPTIYRNIPYIMYMVRYRDGSSVEGVAFL